MKIVIAIALVSLLSGQGRMVPTLTEVQKLKITNSLQAVDIAHMKKQEAERKYEESIENLKSLLDSLHKAGYELDTLSMQYVPVK